MGGPDAAAAKQRVSLDGFKARFSRETIANTPRGKAAAMSVLASEP